MRKPMCTAGPVKSDDQPTTDRRSGVPLVKFRPELIELAEQREEAVTALPALGPALTSSGMAAAVAP